MEIFQKLLTIRLLRGFLIGILVLGDMPSAISQSMVSYGNQARLNHVSHSNGHAVADYDLDGDLDIFIVARKSFIEDDNTTWNRLLQNNGDGTFDDKTISAGFSEQYIHQGDTGRMGQKMGVSWGDYDDDGYPDILLTNYRDNLLYHNEGDGTFRDVTSESGLKSCATCYSTSALWWDYDNDSDIDLYISDWVNANRLYKNNGNGTFSDVTGISQIGGQGETWTSVPFDVNNDGWLDLYVVNDFSHNRFYLNNQGEDFTEISDSLRLDDEGDGMGITIADYNNDGLFDFYITNIYLFHPNALFTNYGNGIFRNEARIYDLEDTGWGWGTHFFDCDHDGDLDLYAVNGFDLQDGTNAFYINTLDLGQPGFRDWSESSGTDSDEQARSMEVFDFDDDGDLDVLVSNWNTSPHLYRNETILAGQSTNNKNWLKLELEGTVSNKNAIGTTVEVTVGDKLYYRYHHGAALLSQSIKPVHFGLADAEFIDQIRILWPSGIEEVAKDIQVNQTIRVKENSGNLFSVVTSVESDPTNLFNIYPNPFTDILHVDLEINVPGNYSIQIFTLTGNMLFEESKFIQTKSSVELSSVAENLSNGIYLIKVEGGSFSEIRKLIKGSN